MVSLGRIFALFNYHRGFIKCILKALLLQVIFEELFLHLQLLFVRLLISLIKPDPELSLLFINLRSGLSNWCSLISFLYLFDYFCIFWSCRYHSWLHWYLMHVKRL